MLLETRYKTTFSRAEVVEALKSHFPDRLPVQAIPRQASDAVTTPTMSATADTLDITWTRLAQTG